MFASSTAVLKLAKAELNRVNLSSTFFFSSIVVCPSAIAVFIAAIRLSIAPNKETLALSKAVFAEPSK